MTDNLMSCLPATEKQKDAITRLLRQLGVEERDIGDCDRETANHFLKQLFRKTKHMESDLDI